MLKELSVFVKRPLPTTKIKIIGFQVKRWCANLKNMRILNVAEKNDAAKTISSLLSGGRTTKRNGPSVFNKIYEFPYEVLNRQSLMVMTSVSGHLLNYDFVNGYRYWESVDPLALFEAPITKKCIDGMTSTMKNLQKEIKACNTLIIWTDCDREGENIGFEIIEVCKAVKPNIQVYRAKFSELTYQSVTRALKNLEQPNKFINDAVNVRMELDLRIGAAFTRFQCLHLRKAFPTALKDNLVSYGSCQFPTMGFIIDRFKAISEFVPEPFWKIDVKHDVDNLTVNFNWKRNHLFDKLACEVLLDKCLEKKEAKVINVKEKAKTKWRPKPLDTVELEKIVSKKLWINAKETLKIAEKLYTQGLISYPRTETNIFPKELNLVPLVQQQTGDPNWGDFAQKLLIDGPNPFQGKKTDQAHPPIHPLKYTDKLIGNEKVIYEFIVRHFLACLSKHAEGHETQIEIDIAEEKFVAKGLVITARNYLEVYPYEKWSESEIPKYQEGDTFIPQISMNESQTSPPELLTEADLIALMEKHGIGTDATHADHIDKIKTRLYVGLQNDRYFVPRTLGMGLVEGYNNMGYEMATPSLRSELEADLTRICNKEKTPEEVLAKHLAVYKEIFQGVQSQANRLSETIQAYIQIEAQPVEQGPPSWSAAVNKVVKKCESCGSSMILKSMSENRYFVGCLNFPQCRHALWFPKNVKEAVVTDEVCPSCGPDIHMVRFNFERGSCYLPTDYLGCLGGCDDNLMGVLLSDQRSRTREKSDVETGNHPSPLRESNDSGYSSNAGNETWGTRGGAHVDAKVVCKCQLPANEFEVKNSGPNMGRKFYKCGSTKKKCDFFQWKDESKNNRSYENGMKKTTRNYSTVRNPVIQNDDGETTRCYCAVLSKRLVVQKDGPNKGRAFYSCGKSRTDKDKCRFFKWADENSIR